MNRTCGNGFDGPIVYDTAELVETAADGAGTGLIIAGLALLRDSGRRGIPDRKFPTVGAPDGTALILAAVHDRQCTGVFDGADQRGVIRLCADNRQFAPVQVQRQRTVVDQQRTTAGKRVSRQIHRERLVLCNSRGLIHCQVRQERHRIALLGRLDCLSQQAIISQRSLMAHRSHSESIQICCFRRNGSGLRRKRLVRIERGNIGSLCKALLIGTKLVAAAIHRMNGDHLGIPAAADRRIQVLGMRLFFTGIRGGRVEVIGIALQNIRAGACVVGQTGEDVQPLPRAGVDDLRVQRACCCTGKIIGIC